MPTVDVASLAGMLMLLFLVALGVAVFVFWVWMLIHAITNRGLSDMEKLLWVILVVFLPLLGTILYFFIGRPKGSTTPPLLR